METLFETVVTYLDSKKLHYTRSEDCSVVLVSYHLNNICVNCTVTIDEDNRYLSFCSRSGLVAAPDRYDAVAEFVTDINLRFNAGSLLFDRHGGDIFYKASIFVGTAALAPQMLRNLLSTVHTYDSIYPRLVDIIYRDVEPFQAFLDAILAHEAQSTQKEINTQKEIDTVFAKLMEGMGDTPPTSGFDIIKAQVQDSPEGVLLPMKDLVIASGQRRAGKLIARRIEESLLANGLGHEPSVLPCSQSSFIRIFKRGTAD